MIRFRHSSSPTLTLTLFFSLFLLLSSSLRAAQWHHVHLLAPDTKAAAQWYAKHMEGEVAEVAGGAYDAAVFGKTKIIFKKADAGFAPTDGSSVDHIGWSFKDLDAKMKEFEAAGIKILAPARPLGKIKFGFIVDPNGVKIEVMQDPELYGFHHVHAYVPDPDATVNWFISAFGGEATKYGGMLPAVKNEAFWIIMLKTPKAKERTEGRAVDHIGWTVEDVAKETEVIKTKGAKVLQEPQPFGNMGAKVAFIEEPNGIKIELLQLPKP